jgi:hypothetical protein
MTTLLDRIPDAQDIFGLLRRWSPVFLTGEDEGYKSAVADPERPDIVTDEGTKDVESVALDLTDKYGRVDAAWFIRNLAEQDGEVWLTLTIADWSLIGVAEAGRNMTPEQIDTLARLVLRLAGRTS